MKFSLRKVLGFISLSLSLMLYFFWSIFYGDPSGNTALKLTAALWIPAIAALFTKLVSDRSLDRLGLSLSASKYMGISFIIPFTACAFVYSITWLSGLGGFTPLPVSVIVYYVLAGTLLSFFVSFGEELGWRGFLAIELFKGFSYASASAILAVLWIVYHYPILFLSGTYQQVSPMGFTFFSVTVIALSFIATWLRIRSGSVYPAALLFASHNVFVQNIFQPMTTMRYNTTSLFTTEFGCGLALIYTFIALYFWRRREELVLYSNNGIDTGTKAI